MIGGRAGSRLLALLLARLVLGLIFFIACLWKVPELKPMAHAEQLLV